MYLSGPETKYACQDRESGDRHLRRIGPVGVEDTLPMPK